MAWTQPATWVDGQVVAASDLNAQIRDNLAYLLAPNVGQVITAAGALSTTSTTYASLGTAWSKSLTLNGGYLEAGLRMMVSGAAATFSTAFFGIDVDGTLYSAALAAISGNQAVTVSFVKLITGLASGAHTVAPKWRVAAGTTTASTDPSVLPLEFWAREA